MKRNHRSLASLSITSLPTALLMALSMACLSIPSTGCVEGRSSTHELEHVVPAHWPTHLGDAADKLEQRLAATNGDMVATQTVHRELLEIIGWLPEIAADTPIRETSWVPIHEACSKIEKLIKAQQQEQAHQQIKNLCVELKKIHQELKPANEPQTNEHQTNEPQAASDQRDKE